MLAQHGHNLKGESPKCGGSQKIKHIAEGKGVYREIESEGRTRQISSLTNRNQI